MNYHACGWGYTRFSKNVSFRVYCFIAGVLGGGSHLGEGVAEDVVVELVETAMAGARGRLSPPIILFDNFL